VPVFSPALRSFRWSAWLSARLRRFYRWRHGGEFARLLIFDQILAFDGIAAAAARVRGHKLGDWRIQDGCAAATCIRCGRQLVVYYSPLQPDMDGSALRNGCLKGSRQSTVLAPPGTAAPSQRPTRSALFIDERRAASHSRQPDQALCRGNDAEAGACRCGREI
jgi:hypothetical protein